MRTTQVVHSIVHRTQSYHDECSVNGTIVDGIKTNLHEYLLKHQPLTTSKLQLIRLFANYIRITERKNIKAWNLMMRLLTSTK